MQIGKISLKWLGHSGFLIKNSKVIYIDPYKIPENSEKADLILITHSHYDHCSVEDIEKILKNGTKVILPADCQSKVVRFSVSLDIHVVSVGDEIDLENVRIFAIPAYNKDKPFHPKEEGWLGYLIKTENVLIYHSGDTDFIPEMQKLTGHKQKDVDFVALLSVGGRFTMSAEEAFEAVKMIKPNIAIPMHYGSVVGNKEDAEEFKELCEEEGFNVKILEKENGSE
jgi:L-ascorbate metabolism protein UlaG (beta-lactamase superfamily)